MKKPTWAEIEALAEKHNAQYSIRELQRFTRDCTFPPDLIAKFWPKATPRRLAMVQGLTRYHGAPCKQHDQTERFVSNSICVICNTERVRAAHLRDRQRAFAATLGAARCARTARRLGFVGGGHRLFGLCDGRHCGVKLRLGLRLSFL